MNIGFLLLCDYSEAVNGKLYLTGGGWNVLRLPELPAEWSFSIGLGIDVAWHELVGVPQGQEQRLVMSIAATAAFTTAGPHAAVVQVNGEELGRARFYLMEEAPPEVGLA